MRVFVDTNYYVSRIMPHDQWHAKALRAIKPGLSYITSSLVINETISLLQARGFLSAAIDFLRASRQSTEVQIIHVDGVLQAAAWDLFARWGGTGANAVDCASFAIMHSLSIKRAFTFDDHFRAAGFEILK